MNAPVALSYTADITEAHVGEAIRFESRLRPNYFRFAKSGEAWFSEQLGSGGVLLTAPHATAAIRDGRLRGPDTGTGWVAHMLHRLAGVSVLSTTYASPSDPNYYDDNAFKARLAVLLERQRPNLVLDLHGCHFSRPFDVDFGTMHGESLLGQMHWLEALREMFVSCGVRRLTDNRFAAARKIGRAHV